MMVIMMMKMINTVLMVMITMTMIKVQVGRSIESDRVESKQSHCMHTIRFGKFDDRDGDGDQVDDSDGDGDLDGDGDGGPFSYLE